MNKILSFFKKYFDVFKAIIVLTVVCLVISAALALTNHITKDKIAEMEKASASAAMEALIKNAEYELADLTDIKGLEGAEIYVATSNNETLGYIITTAAKGYGGDVTVMTAISPDKKVIGVNILSAADETPGLGQNATKPEFYNQFLNKTLGVTVVKNGAKDNEINAVTGATITSRAVTTAVNEALSQLDTYLNSITIPEIETDVSPEEILGTEVQYEE